MTSISDKIMEKIDIIKTTSGTGTTLEQLQQTAPISNVVKANIEQRNKATSQVKIATPSKVEDVIGGGLLFGGASLVSDFWSLFAGTAEEKVNTIESYLPLETVSGLTFPEVATPTLKEAYGEGNILVNPITGEASQVELPDLSGVGKWLLIAGGAIAGLYLLGKYIGRGKR